MLVRTLISADPPRTRSRIERLVREAGGGLAESVAAAAMWARLKHGDWDLVIVGRRAIPDPPGGLVSQIRRLPEHPEVIVVAERETARDRAALLAVDCLAVLGLDLTDDILRDTLRALLRRLHEGAVGRWRAERPDAGLHLNDFVSDSPAMHRFLAVVRRVVGTDSSLLLLGETGSGKERLARAIHAESPRSAGPFVALNCGALPESLLESELFGHEQGAFTGATRARRGYFELAHRGTLFLDEIGEMPQHLQVKLLRVLEDRRIHRVGGERPLDVDVRVIAATNKDLEAEVQSRRFRQDLYFRLAVVTLVLPPLRERREDIPRLVEEFLELFAARQGRRITGIAPAAREALVAYPWPGNVRELSNVMEQVVLLAAGPSIEPSDLPHRIGSTWARTPGRPDLAGATALTLPRHPYDKSLRMARRDALSSFERSYLAGLLERTGGRIGETANRAGINPRSLYSLMRRHGLRKEQFRS